MKSLMNTDVMMDRVMKTLVAGVLLTMPTLAPFSMAAEPVAAAATTPTLKTYEARYEARAMGLSATAYRSLQIVEGDIYELKNSLTLTVFGAAVGSVTETSQFLWQSSDLTPLQYSYEQTGISDRSERVDFDWSNNVAQSSHDDESWSLPLQHGIMDKLSYSTRLGRDISERGLSEVSYNIIDAEDIDVHLYRVAAEEVLSTAAGNLNTIRIERIREPDSDRKTTVWLAKDWDYMLVRLEQINGSRTTELSLESATVDGEPLTGL
ncbi:MAG: DUF3108 domain-containing protein [Gammaproteobacteria bacterium]|nr:DUF3108 domain-containing protein [Gammaproteobacteria bacterium]